VHCGNYEAVGDLVEITDGVLVAQSDVDHTNSTVVVGDGNICLVVDPAVKPDEVKALAAAIKGRGLRVVAGFSTHAHWDHLLWSATFGNVPRYATKRTAEIAMKTRGKLAGEANKATPGHELALLGAVKPVPDSATVPWDGPETLILEHDAHSPGHAALYVKDKGVLIAGDMLSDVEVPTLDLEAENKMPDYRSGMQKMLGLEGLRYLVPGHGKVCTGPRMFARFLDDWHYLDDLSSGRTSKDGRLKGAPAWLTDHHERQMIALKPKA
jgi:glyoxylase-like metal-dependent hydrolase (beta-lactamase superfamily II)